MKTGNPIQRSYGFRCSATDGLVLLVGSGLAYWLWSEAFAFWWVVPLVVGHFFLFCNVFLVWQKWELLWAAAFLVNACIHLFLGEFGWLSTLLVQLPVTFLVIALQLRSPYYHGILARRINGRLDEYLDGSI